MLPGLMVQLPAGRPLSTTLPVGTVHVGWVMAPTTGAVGTPGVALTVRAVGCDTHVLFVVVTL